MTGFLRAMVADQSCARRCSVPAADQYAEPGIGGIGELPCLG